MNKEPKKNLPKITVLVVSSFRTCFDMMFSIDQNKTAVRIRKSPVLKVRLVIFNNKKFPVKSKIAPINQPLLSFSFKKKIAKIAMNINIVLWINAAFTAEVIDNPLKKSKNGIEPPNKPIKVSLNHCDFFSLIRMLNSLNNKIEPIVNKRTARFFEKVNM